MSKQDATSQRSHAPGIPQAPAATAPNERTAVEDQDDDWQAATLPGITVESAEPPAGDGERLPPPHVAGRASARPIATRSFASLFDMLRDHLEREALAQGPAWLPKLRRRDEERPGGYLERFGGDTPGAIQALATAITEHGILLCCSQPLTTIAAMLTNVHEIADLGDAGRPWAEELLLEVSPVLLDRLAEPLSDDHDAWEYAKILAAYGEFARHDGLARRVAEALAAHLKQGFSAEALELRPVMPEGDPGRVLAGCLFTLSQLPHRSLETFHTFELIRSLLARLLDQGERTSLAHAGATVSHAPRTPEVLPEIVTLTLSAFAQLFGCTELDKLPINIERFLLWLVERAKSFVPEELEMNAATPRLNRSQVVRLTAALMQFRRLPPAVAEFLRELSRLTATALEGGLALDDLAALLNGYTSNGDECLDPLLVCEAAISRLATLVKHTRPSPLVVRFAVLAYNRRDVLQRQAMWYARETRRRDWRANRTGGVEQARDEAEVRQARSKACRDELEALLLTTITTVHEALAEYSPSQQRCVLHELTRLQGLAVSESPLQWLGQDPGPVFGEIDHAVAGIFGQLSASRTMLAPLAEAPAHHLARMLQAYRWLRVQQPSDARLVRELTEELESRVPGLVRPR